MGVELLVVGASLGGVQALRLLLGGLPAELGIAVAVAQHRHRHSDDALLGALRPHTPLALGEPDDKEPIRAGTVYFAPADYHLLVAPGWFELSTDPPVCHARPSIDVLFESAADTFGSDVLAVVLTGANDDGVQGARRIQEAGGTVIAQDPATAEAPQMPQAVIQAGVAHHVVPVAEIAALVIELVAAR